MAKNSARTGRCSVYDPTSDTYILIAMLSLTGEESVETEQSRGTPYFDLGTLMVYDEMEQSRELALTLEWEQITEAHKSLIMNRRAASGTFSHPHAQRIVLDDETITVTGLTVDQPCQLTQILNIAPGQRKFIQVSSMTDDETPVPNTPDPGEFIVTANTITINAADVDGPAASLRYYKETTTVVFGGPNVIQEVGTVEIYLEDELTKARREAFYFPRVKINNGALIDIRPGGDPVEVTGLALIDDEKGFGDYFASWYLT